MNSQKKVIGEDSVRLGILDQEKSFIEDFSACQTAAYIESKEVFEEKDVNDLDALLICKSQAFGIKEICEWVIKLNKLVPIWVFTSEELLEEKNVYLQLGVCGVFNGSYTNEEISLSISNSLNIMKSPIQKKQRPKQPFQLDPSKLSLTVEDESISLTRLEYFLIEVLYERKNEVCTYEELASTLFGQSFDPGDDAGQYRVTNIVCKIRAKLTKANQGKQELIKTIRSRGYMLNV
jgi:DNA-binding response OmpR family regulator